MGILDWIILALVAFLVVLAVRHIRSKEKGCSCGCAGCPGQSTCTKRTEGKTKRK